MFKSIRVWRAQQHAYWLWNGHSMRQPSGNLAARVQTRLRPHQILSRTGDLIVTEAGFVTMAVFADLAIEIGETLVVPGVDDRGQRGQLVLLAKAAPFHSLADNAAEAYRESVAARRKADSVVEAFGGLDKLRAAVRRAPWHLVARREDHERSGLCLWGAESYLSRIGLLAVARRYGLPHLLLKLAGPYGERLTAARLLREMREAPSHCLELNQ